MFAIDFKITRLDVEHRRSLLTLLKLEYGNFEPCYVKIPPMPTQPSSSSSSSSSRRSGSSSSSSSSSSRRSGSSSINKENSLTPFGIMTMVNKSALPQGRAIYDCCGGEGEGEGEDEVQLRVEIYHDRDGLDLICYGNHLSQTIPDAKSELTIIEDVHSSKYRADSLVSSTNYLCLQAIRKVKIKLFHKSKGDFHMDAGHLEVTIRYYMVDIGRCLRREQSFDKVDCFCRLNATPVKVEGPSDAYEQFRSSTVEIPSVSLMPKWQLDPSTLATPQPPSEPLLIDPTLSDNDQMQCLEEDYDSVDEFVNSFTSRTSDSFVSLSSIASDTSSQSLKPRDRKLKLKKNSDRKEKRRDSIYAKTLS